MDHDTRLLLYLVLAGVVGWYVSRQLDTVAKPRTGSTVPTFQGRFQS